MISLISGLLMILSLWGKISIGCVLDELAKKIPPDLRVIDSYKNKSVKINQTVQIMCLEKNKQRLNFDENVLELTCLKNGDFNVPTLWPKCEWFCEDPPPSFIKNSDTNSSLILSTGFSMSSVVLEGQSVQYECGDKSQITEFGKYFEIFCKYDTELKAGNYDIRVQIPKCRSKRPCVDNVPKLPENSHLILLDSLVNFEGDHLIYECDPFWKMSDAIHKIHKGRFKITCQSNGLFPSNINFPNCEIEKPTKPCQCLGDLPSTSATQVRNVFCRNSNALNNDRIYQSTTPPSRIRCGSRDPLSSDIRNKCFCDDIKDQSGMGSFNYKVQIQSEPWEWNAKHIETPTTSTYKRLKMLVQKELDKHFKDLKGYVQTFVMSFSKGESVPDGVFPDKKSEVVLSLNNESTCEPPDEFPKNNVSFVRKNESLTIECKNSDHTLISSKGKFMGQNITLPCRDAWRISVWPLCMTVTKKCNFSTIQRSDLTVDKNIIAFKESVEVKCLNSSEALFFNGRTMASIDLHCILNQKSVKFNPDPEKLLCKTPCSIPSSFPKDDLTYYFVNNEYKIRCKNKHKTLLYTNQTLIGKEYILKCESDHVQNISRTWPQCVKVPTSCKLPDNRELMENNLLPANIEKIKLFKSINLSCRNSSYVNSVDGSSFVSFNCNLLPGSINLMPLNNPVRKCQLRMNNSKLNKKSFSYTILNDTFWKVFCASEMEYLFNNESFIGRREIINNKTLTDSNYKCSTIKRRCVLPLEHFKQNGIKVSRFGLKNVSILQTVRLSCVKKGLVFNQNYMSNMNITCTISSSDSGSYNVSFPKINQIMCITRMNKRKKRETTSYHYIMVTVESQFRPALDDKIFDISLRSMNNKHVISKCFNCHYLNMSDCSNGILARFKRSGYDIETIYGKFNESNPSLRSGEFAVLRCTNKSLDNLKYMPAIDNTDSKPHDGMLTSICLTYVDNFKTLSDFSITKLPPCVPTCEGLVHPPNYTNFKISGIIPFSDPKSINSISLYDKNDSLPIYYGDKILYRCTNDEWGINGGLESNYDLISCTVRGYFNAPTRAWPRCTPKTHLITRAVKLLLNRFYRELSERQRLFQKINIGDISAPYTINDNFFSITIPITIALFSVICGCCCCTKNNSPLCKFCSPKGK